ncbi:MAG: rRNA adenine N-6-methyltransferase family protein [Nanoarchaeota archaeon]|nr:rRNA adenine N-6-methyltransferase family protein [Nanoarchaeota archaeon]
MINKQKINKTNNFGQHFLTDKDVLNEIISNSKIAGGDIVLEIGAGRGILTVKLSKLCKKLIVVEIDPDFIPELKKIKNITLINDNILNVIDSLFFNKIIANIPYNISEPLMKKILREDIDSLTLLIGKKFWDILNSGKKISTLISCFYKISFIRLVSPGSFSPPPRTLSVLVKFDKIAPDSLADDKKILKEIILQKDKKLKNALRESLTQVYRQTKRYASEKVSSLNLPQKVTNKSILDISNRDFEELFGSLEKL